MSDPFRTSKHFTVGPGTFWLLFLIPWMIGWAWIIVTLVKGWV